MKHLLNNLSDEEKNSIREQHKGGMKVMTESFSKLIKSKLGDVKPLVSEQTQSLQTSGETTTNPYKDQSLLNKFVGKQFQTYVHENNSDTGDVGEPYRIFEISKVTPDMSAGDNRLIFDLGEGRKAIYNCNNLNGDIIHIRDLKIDNGVKSLDDYGNFYKAPSLTKELKQTFCTVGSAGKLVPKVDYPTP